MYCKCHRHRNRRTKGNGINSSKVYCKFEKGCKKWLKNKVLIVAKCIVNNAIPFGINCAI